jgi:hypothetical protein
MKKLTAVIMLLALMLSLFTGCFFRPKLPNLPSNDQQEQNDNSNSENEDNDVAIDEEDNEDSDSEDEDTDDSDPYASMEPATNPQTGFSNYSTVKGEAIDRIYTASESSDELSMSVAMSMMSIAMVDLGMLSLSILGEDPQIAASALSMFGYSDVDVKVSGNTYVVTYTDTEGVQMKQTCEYDTSKDQLTSTLYDGNGAVSMFFEYVNLGDAYAAQYYYPDSDTYYVIRAYFDADNIAAFGSASSAAEPDSIFGGSSFDEKFVINDESYMILKDGKLTVFDNGTEMSN